MDLLTDPPTQYIFIHGYACLIYEFSRFIFINIQHFHHSEESKTNIFKMIRDKLQEYLVNKK